MLKKRYIVILAVLLCGGILLARNSGNRRFVDRAVRYAQWSRNSRYLFYSKSEKKLFRYDTRTGKRQIYNMPDRLDQFDVSPDGRFVMFPMVRDKTYGVYIMEPASQKIQKVFIMKNAVREFTYGVTSSGKRQKALESLKWITSICWLRPQSALLLVERPKGHEDIYLLDMKRSAFVALRTNVYGYSWTSDNTGFLYADSRKRYHYFSLTDKTDKLLNFGNLDIDEMGFLYISKHHVVFTYNKPKRTARILDLNNMKIRPVSLPEIENISDISYDLKRCLTGSNAHPSALSGWVSNRVYVMDLPEETGRELRRLEH